MTYTHHIATQPLGVNFSVAMSHFVDDINFTVNIISEKKAEMCAWNTWAVNEKVSVVFNTRECLRCVFYICLNMLKKAKWISLMNDIIRHIGNFSSWVTALSHSFAPWYIYLYVWLLLLYILLSNAASIWPRIFLECVHKSYFWLKLLTFKMAPFYLSPSRVWRHAKSRPFSNVIRKHFKFTREILGTHGF